MRHAHELPLKSDRARWCSKELGLSLSEPSESLSRADRLSEERVK
jgi:hypothetical protein